MPEDELFLNYGIFMATQRQGDPNQRQTIAVGKIFTEIFLDANRKGVPVWTDSDASFRLTGKYLSGQYAGQLTTRTTSVLQHAEAAARDLCSVSMAACRAGNNVINKVRNEAVGPSQLVGRGRAMAAWMRGMEHLRLHAYSSDVRMAHESLRDGDMNVNINAFSRDDSPFMSLLGVEKVYRVVGLTILVYPDAIYVLDYSLLDQVHEVSKFWEGSYLYASNYRLSGQWCKFDMLSALEASIDWIHNALADSEFSESLPRSMKQSVSLMQNDFHTVSEVLDVHHEEKSKKLKETIVETLPLKVYWHEHLLSMNIPDRAKMDIANLYYGLPAPDCDVRALFSRATDYMSSARSVIWKIWDEFLAYTKALDLCKALCKFGADVKYETEEGYDLTSRPFYKRCIKGQLSLPPDDEMGKAWISRHFEYTDTVSSWYYDAGDVTRIDADLSYYQSYENYNTRRKDQVNELLYALEYAPLLSGGRTPEEVYSNLSDGTDKWDRVAEMAAKSENTKPGNKVRETWSADDITRELTSAYDKCGVPLAMLYAGATARKKR